MNYQFKNDIEGMRRDLLQKDIDPGKVEYWLGKISNTAEEISDKANTDRKNLDFLRDQIKNDQGVLRELLESKRVQFIVSFIMNVVMVLILSSVYLASHLK